MNTGGDAAEQVVRLSLEGFEVAAKLTGTAAKELTVLLVSVLKQEQKTKGKARLTNMLKSGKELKVFSVPNKDLKKFTEQAKKYGVLYCVLRDKYSKDDNAPVDIIARAEDASKIQRIFDRFELGNVDRVPSLPMRKRALPSVRSLQTKCRPNQRAKGLWRKQWESPFRRTGHLTKTPRSPRRTKTLRQGKAPPRSMVNLIRVFPNQPKKNLPSVKSSNGIRHRRKRKKKQTAPTLINRERNPSPKTAPIRPPISNPRKRKTEIKTKRGNLQ